MILWKLPIQYEKIILNSSEFVLLPIITHLARQISMFLAHCGLTGIPCILSEPSFDTVMNGDITLIIFFWNHSLTVFSNMDIL